MNDGHRVEGPQGPPPPVSWPELPDPVNLPPQTDEERRALLARYGSWPVVLLVLLVAVALASVLSFPVLWAVVTPGEGLDTAAFDSPLSVFLLIAVEDVVFLALVYLLLVRRRITSWADMGLVGPKARTSLLAGVGWGILFVVTSALIEVILASFGVVQTQAELFPLQEAGVAGKVAIWVAGVVFAPFAEEVFFRGYIFRAMRARKGLNRALVYSAILFGLLHANLAAFLPIAVGAVLLGVAYHRSGSLWTPIVAHAVNNLFAFTLILLQ